MISLTNQMRKGVAFNPRWIGNQPAWDVRLLNGDIHRGVTTLDIRKTSKRNYIDVVRECDIQDYAKHHLKLLKEENKC